MSNSFFMASLYVMRIQPEVLKRGGLTNAPLATSRNLLRERAFAEKALFTGKGWCAFNKLR